MYILKIETRNQPLVSFRKEGKITSYETSVYPVITVEK